MFAYRVLLHDPKPHPLLCVEEPENQLYPKLMAEPADPRRRADQGLHGRRRPDGLSVEARLLQRRRPGMKALVFLLEEESAKLMLLGLLPRVFDPRVQSRLMVFEGKQDIETQRVERWRG